MKSATVINRNFLLLFTPLVASSTLVAAPSLAASFASSSSTFNLFNFSHSAESSSVSADFNVLAVTPEDSNSGEELASSSSQGSSVVAEADSNIFAFFPPSFGSGTISSDAENQAFGNGSNYLGESEVESKVLANFLINPESGSTETFSFDFNTFLDLETSTSKVSTKAAVDISFFLLGRSNPDSDPIIFDFFSASGKLENIEGNDQLSVQSSNTFNIDVVETFDIIDLNSGFKQADVFTQGSYQRDFEFLTYLTLVGVSKSEATVKAPEPSSTLGLVLCVALISLMASKNKRSKLKEKVAPNS
ncbi:MAG: hypothetical protein F6K58_10765 [Symploca sp. SIO2E9]|nr:hypothetical protein [Symploca sp. SIO2E9]